MTTLFGVPTPILAGALAGLTTTAAIIILLLAARNPILVKLGVRHIPRRRARSVLIVVDRPRDELFEQIPAAGSWIRSSDDGFLATPHYRVWFVGRAPTNGNFKPAFAVDTWTGQFSDGGDSIELLSRYKSVGRRLARTLRTMCCSPSRKMRWLHLRREARTSRDSHAGQDQTQDQQKICTCCRLPSTQGL